MEDVKRIGNVEGKKVLKLTDGALIIGTDKEDEDHVLGIVTPTGFVFKYISKQLYEQLEKELREAEEYRS